MIGHLIEAYTDAKVEYRYTTHRGLIVVAQTDWYPTRERAFAESAFSVGTWLELEEREVD